MQKKTLGQIAYKEFHLFPTPYVSDKWDDLPSQVQSMWENVAQAVCDELMVTIPLEELPNLDIESPEGSDFDGNANQPLSGQAALKEIQKKTHWDKDKR